MKTIIQAAVAGYNESMPLPLTDAQLPQPGETCADYADRLAKLPSHLPGDNLFVWMVNNLGLCQENPSDALRTLYKAIDDLQAASDAIQANEAHREAPVG